jgi:AmmeMemoRadiSam system protein B/AmmeMemoRadiSam system protein A
VRPPAVAGTFYTDAPRPLARTVDHFLAATPVAEGPAPKAIVVPHAGYIYSGAVAGRGYAQLASRADAITRVVLLGPAHRVPVRSMAVPSVEAFRTPLGDVPIDGDLVRVALACDGVVADDRAHAPEHSLEVQLPFLQRLLSHPFTVLPVVVGGATPREVAALLDAVWGGPETLVVVSSDLSHYESYDDAARHDAMTARRVVHLDWAQIQSDDACGAHPLRGLLALAEARGARVELVDLRSSGDTAGDRSRVVGYGAFALHELEARAPGRAQGYTEALDQAELDTLGSIAVQALERSLGQPLRSDGSAGAPTTLTHRLRSPGASFVTLRDRHHELLGCIGSLEPRLPLAADVAHNAVAAATRDPRFRPVRATDLAGGDLHVSVLTPHVPLDVVSRDDLLATLRPLVDGLVIEAGNHRATFLPSVWEQLDSP